MVTPIKNSQLTPGPRGMEFGHFIASSFGIQRRRREIKMLVFGDRTLGNPAQKSRDCAL